MTSQFYDGEAVNVTAADWTPTATGKSFARAVLVGGVTGTAYTMKVDFFGSGEPGSSPQVGVTLNVFGGQLVQIAVKKIYHTGSTVVSCTALY